jgi:hypothetical protein
VSDAQDGYALIAAEYRSTSPASLDDSLQRLPGRTASPHREWSIHRSRGRLVIDPPAITVEESIIVPDCSDRVISDVL